MFVLFFLNFFIALPIPITTYTLLKTLWKRAVISCPKILFHLGEFAPFFVVVICICCCFLFQYFSSNCGFIFFMFLILGFCYFFLFCAMEMFSLWFYVFFCVMYNEKGAWIYIYFFAFICLWLVYRLRIIYNWTLIACWT